MEIGYARVSTLVQSLDLQTDARSWTRRAGRRPSGRIWSKRSRTCKDREVSPNMASDVVAKYVHCASFDAEDGWYSDCSTPDLPAGIFSRSLTPTH
jgi:hypothetical protein